MTEFNRLSRENRLIDICENKVKNELIFLNNLKKGNTNEKSFISYKWYDHECFSIKALFIENDVVQAKQHFYLCGRIDDYLISQYNKPILEYGISHISYALLSDNLNLINRYAHLSHNGYEKITKKGSIIHAIQLAIKDELHRVYIDVLDKLSQKKSQTAIQPDVQFFSSLINKDKSGCEAAINELLTSRRHKQRNKHMELINEFISHPAIGYAKLAWLKGIDVEIDNPLVPKLLLPISPNDRYIDEYEFRK